MSIRLWLDDVRDPKRLGHCDWTLAKTADDEPLLDYSGKLRVGSQLAISYDKIREHRKSSEFLKHP